MITTIRTFITCTLLLLHSAADAEPRHQDMPTRQRTVENFQCSELLRGDGAPTMAAIVQAQSSGRAARRIPIDNCKDAACIYIDTEREGPSVPVQSGDTTSATGRLPPSKLSIATGNSRLPNDASGINVGPNKVHGTGHGLARLRGGQGCLGTRGRRGDDWRGTPVCPDGVSV